MHGNEVLCATTQNVLNNVSVQSSFPKQRWRHVSKTAKQDYKRTECKTLYKILIFLLFVYYY